ncbi:MULTISPECIES: nitroreductase family protein [unclassified Mycolicibacterium]|uniref:nitroreductase family protein n=1 Tax=unclassified Mycolicibacterium TaxID=2636767 RepID=UPI00130B2CC6|nr:MULTISPECIES: nitroreductase family protein [unclassified Mycolicibacterium]MUL84240.1 nitroreductase [Mycolicibacterium sp. CBMA 329]MUL89694.1 nitroreductase [Mycolicibacterium sp. CBMA 331]MUL99869.1 nitroreductase [Mycolicibacterium sp. CBMA 334]MUM27024.1 nitroreductase [Mycolicibacterium sp. CBMA 295]MUM39209.1 nitroreductase [Mycolicibacterium sp. CBMA 247]
MPDTPTGRPAATTVPIHPDLAARWSPRAFDPDATVTADQLIAVLEAARWAASWGHRQPVRFVVGVRSRTRGGQKEGSDETFVTLAGLLKRGNSYAHAAGALILVCADEGEDERTARYAGVDAGAAIAQLTVEAVSRGLIVHPMAGFDVDGARAAFGIPDGVRPLAVIAVGTLGDYSHADEAIAERDSRPRERLPLDQIAFSDTWGTAAVLRPERLE